LFRCQSGRSALSNLELRDSSWKEGPRNSREGGPEFSALQGRKESTCHQPEFKAILFAIPDTQDVWGIRSGGHGRGTKTIHVVQNDLLVRPDNGCLSGQAKKTGSGFSGDGADFGIVTDCGPAGNSSDGLCC
jgi:hypothetical protein